MFGAPLVFKLLWNVLILPLFFKPTTRKQMHLKHAKKIRNLTIVGLFIVINLTILPHYQGGFVRELSTNSDRGGSTNSGSSEWTTYPKDQRVGRDITVSSVW